MHYQWVVVHDFLRRTVGQQLLDSVLDTSGLVPRVVRRFYKWKYEPFMPVQFSMAAYRFGHSQIRGGYVLNSTVPPLPTFKPGRIEDEPLGSFGGFRKLPPASTIEWARFFEVRGLRSRQAPAANPLKYLPEEIPGSRPSLIDRNLTGGIPAPAALRDGRGETHGSRGVVGSRPGPPATGRHPSGTTSCRKPTLPSTSPGDHGRSSSPFRGTAGHRWAARPQPSGQQNPVPVPTL